MLRLIECVSNITAVIGLLVCLVSGLARLKGTFYLFKTFEAGTVFLVGVAMISVTALAKVYVLDRKRMV